jgi:hypothetical protein
MKMLTLKLTGGTYQGSDKMMPAEIVNRLRIDPGQLTIGQLFQAARPRCSAIEGGSQSAALDPRYQSAHRSFGHGGCETHHLIQPEPQ